MASYRALTERNRKLAQRALDNPPTPENCGWTPEACAQVCADLRAFIARYNSAT